MLSGVMLSVINAKCYNFEIYTECRRHTECRSLAHMLRVVMQSIANQDIMLLC
jgi:hypothetical protein